jgi:hypothetical protein
VNADRRDLENVMRLDRNLTGPPQSELASWPIASPVTLHTLALKMISISDTEAKLLLIACQYPKNERPATICPNLVAWFTNMSRWSFRTVSDVPPKRQDLADRWHDRAHESESEERKVLTSLATGVIAAFFIALTGERGADLNRAQQIAAMVAVMAMALMILCSLFGWYADSRRSYHEGTAFQHNQDAERQAHSNLARRWSAYTFRALVFSRLLFFIGIAAAAFYTVVRANLL